MSCDEPRKKKPSSSESSLPFPLEPVLHPVHHHSPSSSINMSARNATASPVLRDLTHLEAPRKGLHHRIRLLARQRRSPKQIVPSQARIAFWNIVPGDIVSSNRGSVNRQYGFDIKDGKVRPQGKVERIDRTRNFVYLSSLDPENPKAPRQIVHRAPMLLDVNAGPQGGYTPNIFEVPAPVHYSNLHLRIPDDLLDADQKGTEVYARKMVRKNTRFDSGKKMWRWDRYAMWKDGSGHIVSKKIPWPPEPRDRRSEQDDTTRKGVVDAETWLPWDPSSSVFTQPPKQNHSPWTDWAPIHAALNRIRSEGRHRIKTGQYLGFQQHPTPRPPPAPQLPTPAETLAHARLEQTAWARGLNNGPTKPSAVGGKASTASAKPNFSYTDYLSLAPLNGPANGGSWSLLLTSPSSSLSNSSDATPSRLPDGSLTPTATPPTKATLDSYPLELLMTTDLFNPLGRKARSEKYQAKLAREAEAREKKEVKEQRNLLVLREWVRRRRMAERNGSSEAEAEPDVQSQSQSQSRSESEKSAGEEGGQGGQSSGIDGPSSVVTTSKDETVL